MADVAHQGGIGRGVENRVLLSGVDVMPPQEVGHHHDVIPLQFEEGAGRQSLGLDGSESYDIAGLQDGVQPRARLTVRARRSNGDVLEFPVLARIDSGIEVEYYRHGGVLQYVLRKLLANGQ